MYQTLRFEKRERKVFVTVNRPEAMNALNPQVLEELYALFKEMEKDSEVGVVILTGGKSLRGRADISAMNQMSPRKVER